jgi:tetratricopeptide (TPR) repeat protein
MRTPGTNPRLGRLTRTGDRSGTGLRRSRRVVGVASLVCGLWAWVGDGTGMTLVSGADRAEREAVPGRTAAPVVDASAVRLVEFGGRVEVDRGGKDRWTPARMNDVLVPGDRVRTAADSRATFQFSDRSVFRLNQSSVLEIRPVASGTGRRSLFLRIGEMFFLDRERPARLEIVTPTSTSAIRGTEFVLSSEGPEGVTRLVLLDGAVLMSAGGGEVEVGAGQSATVLPGGRPEVRPWIEAVSRVQWCLYYPGVMVPEELRLGPGDTERLGESLARYREGDLRGALAALPEAGTYESADAAWYVAGLRLSVGQSSDVDRLLRGVEFPVSREVGMGMGMAGAMRTLLAAVRGEELDPAPGLAGGLGSASEALAASYYWQSRSELDRARTAAQQAAELAPGSGFAWVRRAELEWAVGRRREALEYLERGRELGPRNPMASVVAGYVELESGRAVAAREHFERARDLDGSLADVWVGLGLVAERLGDRRAALEELQVAAAVEPRRAVVRSYLGKAWAAAGESALADDEFGLALGLDAEDPTAWLYRGLHRQQEHRLNESVRDLQESVARNDGRSVFRSSLLLDRDRAMRRADLSITYAAVGLGEWAGRTASRGDRGRLFRVRRAPVPGEDPAAADGGPGRV